MSTPGEKFKDTFLSRYPKSQWPAYIDEIATDVSAKIGIGETGLHQYNFPEEVGPYYHEGMLSAGGQNGDVERVLGETVSERELGTVVFQLNRLAYEINQRDTGLDNVQRAIEAVLEKLLTQETGLDFSDQHHRDTGATADIVMELFSRESVAEEAEILLDEFEQSLGTGLLSKLDEPQMMTPLWDHQFSALRAWKQAGYRGYADMATATGKTVLGLAAIALRYGALHPTDDLEGARSTDRDKILIVAHSDLILEQWRREFDRHLNIPQERTRGANEITLSWGEVHFRTPQRLRNQSRYGYDLVILDEAHHYATGQQWGELLERFDDDILALSGSIDDAGKDSEAIQERLRSKVGPEIQRYDIAAAQADGIIPAFDWEIRYAPYQQDDEFVELTQSIRRTYEQFVDRVESGEFDTDRRLHTFGDIRTFSHTSAGRELKQSDEEFRELATGLFSRQTKRWHLSPRLPALVEVVREHSTDHVVVLVDSNAQVEAVASEIEAELPTRMIMSVTSELNRGELLDEVNEFNDFDSGGVLVGTGDLLGEGVDIPNANVAVNMATGGVNPQLVQRIGRILRNPSGDKHAHFYNVVGVPYREAAIPSQDGRRLVEDAAKFFALGDRFHNLPGFALAGELSESDFENLLFAGADEIESLRESNRYEPPNDPIERTHLDELLNTIGDHRQGGGREVLGEWSEYSWVESSDRSEPTEPRVDSTEAASVVDSGEVRIVVKDQTGSPIPDVDLSIIADGNREVPVTTDESGFETDPIPADVDMLTIELSKSGFVDRQSQIKVDAIEPPLEFELQPKALDEGFEFVKLDGGGLDADCVFEVTTSEGVSLGGASISLVGDEFVEYVRTGDDGRASVKPPDQETSVRASVRHDGHPVRTGEVELISGATLRIELPDEP